LAVGLHQEYEPKRHCIVLRLPKTVEPFPAEWSLRLGDVVSNYRASLDHLAWALVKRGNRAGSLSEEEERRVYFPIFTSPTEFSRRAPGRLPGVRRTDLAIVRRHQPYQRGKRKLADHVLSVLNACSNLDKHRALQTTVVTVVESVLTIQRAHDCIITDSGLSIVRTEPMQPGAELGRIRVRRTGPEPRLEMNGKFGADVAIEGKTRLRQWLNETQRFVGSLLAEFSDPPKGVIYIPPGSIAGWP
jgi:hypothetical protein